ncbi:PREDICTED: ras and Rab interactor-like protein isoform X3 [Chinchilla lanigera]|uniref:ras and Rab interactor-like protein isoform X3 n=1 Tax=Chinchilla lanigera TaxID=34839 RepID=UPI00038EBB97|nr:PREDICTED: ras and Rab interactor-like protein isoform X3 [Chinchilla lanigera]
MPPAPPLPPPCSASSLENTFTSCCSGLPLGPDHGSLASSTLKMAWPGDVAPAVPSERQRLVLPQTNGAGEIPPGVLSTPEPLLRLQRTWGVWQVPELDGRDAEALMAQWPMGSFLVTGPDSSQALVLRTSPGEINTYQIQKFPGGVSLESSNLCMPDLPHLLAFLSASRDVLPRTLLLPPPALTPGDKHTDPLQVGQAQADTSRRVLSVVNQLYLDTHGSWGLELTPEETAQGHSPGPPRRAARRNPGPHRVSWVEDPPSAQVHQPRRALASLAEEQRQENKDNYRDEEEDAEDELTAHIRALARARSSYVARQCRALRARLASDVRGPSGPGDPATELLQDVRHLLTDLQDYLAKDPDVRSVFGSRAPGAPHKDKDLGPAVEAAVYRAVLAPLKPTLWTQLRTLRAQELRRLRRRQIALRAGAGPEGQSPAPALRSRIHARLAHLHAACSPRRKVALLLAACGDVYAGLAGGENQGKAGWARAGLWSGRGSGLLCARGVQGEGSSRWWQVAAGTWEPDGGDCAPQPPRDLTSGFPRAPGGRRLPACADRGADLESAHRGDAAGRGVSYGALGSRGASGRGRVLPDHVVRGAAPHCPLPARRGPRAPGAQLGSQRLPAPVAPPADAARTEPARSPGPAAF